MAALVTPFIYFNVSEFEGGSKLKQLFGLSSQYRCTCLYGIQSHVSITNIKVCAYQMCNKFAAIEFPLT